MADANANSAESAAERHHHSSVMTDRNNDNDENCGEAAPPANKAASAVNNFVSFFALRVAALDFEQFCMRRWKMVCLLVSF